MNFGASLARGAEGRTSSSAMYSSIARIEHVGRQTLRPLNATLPSTQRANFKRRARSATGRPRRARKRPRARLMPSSVYSAAIS